MAASPDSPSIAAIALDIDGTLLDSRGRLSRANRDAMLACRRKGILVLLATARPQRIACRPHECWGDAAVIGRSGAFYNGAMASDGDSGYVAHRMLGGDAVHAACELVLGRTTDVQVVIQFGEDYHSMRIEMDDAQLAGWGFARHELRPFDHAMRQPCSKIVISHNERPLDHVWRELRTRLSDDANIYLTDSQRCIQITSSEATKERALIELLARRGITPERVAVFGDDWQDAGMLRTFAHSVAMANAHDPLKALARHITRSNDQDGVAWALHHLFGLA